MAKPVVAQKPQEEEKEPTEEEETPDVPPVEEPSGGAENPGEETGIGQEGDSSQGEGGNGSTGQPPDEEGETGTDTPPIVTIDPDDVLPDPGSGSTSQETVSYTHLWMARSSMTEPSFVSFLALSYQNSSKSR